MRSVFERARLAGRFAWAIAAFAVACLAAEAHPSEVRSIPSAEIHNLFALPGGLYSGSAPENEKAFEELKALGVKTVLSVDGALPNVELARKHGLRYIHMPIGYNGTTTSNANLLVKAAASVDGPIFIHCHHGKHRGPAAAAIICEGRGEWKAAQALEWLQTAGTGAEYTGLFKMVENFRPPTKSEMDRLPRVFPERAQPPGLVAEMVELDLRMDNLKALKAAGFRALPADGGQGTGPESLLLLEQLREIRRREGASRSGPDFDRRLKEAEEAAQALHLAVSSPDRKVDLDAAGRLLSKVSQTCVDCHRDFRNR